MTGSKKITFVIIALSWFSACLGQYNFNVHSSVGVDSIIDIGSQAIELSTNRGYLACGTASGIFTGYSAGYLVKVKNNGDTIWKKQYNFSAIGGDHFTDAAELQDKNYLIVGTTYDSAVGNADIFLTKIDTNGVVLWFQKYAHNDNDQSSYFSITPDNKVIIVGNTTPNSTTPNDIVLIKTDLTGNLIWRKTIGNSLEEVFLSIQVIKNNTEYLLGGREGFYNMSNPYFDFGIVRTDTAGNLVWRNSYGTPSGNEPCGSAIYTLDGGFVLSGTYGNQGALMKLDSAGNQTWIQYLPICTSDFIQTVKQLSDSTFIMIGSAECGTNVEGTGVLLKADKDGNQVWQRKFKGKPTVPDYFYGFNTTSDGGFIITGQYNNIGQPYQNLWLIKTDSLGCDTIACSFSTGIITSTYSCQTNAVIYPNPSAGHFSVSLSMDDEGKPVTILITDILGRKIYSTDVMANLNLNFEINVNLQPGLYVVKGIRDKRTLFESRLVIDK